MSEDVTNYDTSTGSLSLRAARAAIEIEGLSQVSASSSVLPVGDGPAVVCNISKRHYGNKGWEFTVFPEGNQDDDSEDYCGSIGSGDGYPSREAAVIAAGLWLAAFRADQSPA